MGKRRIQCMAKRQRRRIRCISGWGFIAAGYFAVNMAECSDWKMGLKKKGAERGQWPCLHAREILETFLRFMIYTLL